MTPNTAKLNPVVAGEASPVGSAGKSSSTRGVGSRLKAGFENRPAVFVNASCKHQLSITQNK